jgi:proteasome lid subunit RPN8/RPN11
VTVLRLPRTVLEDSFGQLRSCGKGRAECVLYWCAPLDRPDKLTRVVHPVHEAGYAWYEVDSAWLTGFFLDLRRRRETVLVQVHTHPAGAGHSETDDMFSLAPAAGFLSLVVPQFATGSAGLAGTALVVMQPDGTWEPTDPGEVFRVE